MLSGVRPQIDAQFFPVRVESITEQVAGSSLKTPSAAAGRSRAATTEATVELSELVFVDGDFVERQGKDTLYTHQVSDMLNALTKTDAMRPRCPRTLDERSLFDLSEHTHTHTHAQLVRCKSQVGASDREATIRWGMAIDIYGNELKISRPWFPMAVRPTEAGFRRQLLELVSAVTLFSEEPRPALLTHWHGRTKWETNPQVVLERAMDHCVAFGETHRNAPPSAFSAKKKDEPDGWRCSSWDVRGRLSSLATLGCTSRSLSPLSGRTPLRQWRDRIAPRAHRKCGARADCSTF